jgi:hypothetical protein
MHNFYFSKTNLCFCLGSSNLSKVQIRLLFKTLFKNHSLHTMSAGRKDLDDEDIEELMTALATNDFLEKLEIDNNALTANGLIKIAETLRVNRHLKFLSLEGNDLSKEGEEVGMSEMCNALKENDSLIYLSLAHTKLTAKSAPFLLNLMQTNKSLIMLDLNGNKIPFEAIRFIQERLVANRKEYEKERIFEYQERQNIKNQDIDLREINQEQINRGLEIADIKAKVDEHQLWRERLYAEEVEKQEEFDRRLERRLEKEANVRATRKKKRVPKPN